MITHCKECDTAFAVDDEKIENKKFAYTCPKCGAENIVDNRQDIPVAAAAVSTPAASESDIDSSDGLEIEDDVFGADDFSSEEISESPLNASEAEESFEDSALEEKLSDTDLGNIDSITGESAADSPEIEASEVITEDESLSLDEFSDLGEESPLQDIDLEAPMDSGEQPEATGDAGDEFSEEIDLSELSKSAEDDVDLGSIISDQGDEPEEIGDEKLDINLDDFGDDLGDLNIEPESATPGEPGADSMSANEGDELLDVLSDMGEDIQEEDLNEPKNLPDLTDLQEEDIAEEIDKIHTEESEDITIDLDSLDIDIEESSEITTPQEDSGGLSVMTDIRDDEEDITIDLDSLDIDIEEEPSQEQPVASESTTEDESITLDLDSLDIDLVEDETPVSGEVPEDINLDALDLVGDEFEEPVTSKEEEDITLDLDNLDIPLAETDEVSAGIQPEEEKLTLEDAGLTLDEIAPIEMEEKEEEEKVEDDEIRLTLDEIDPNLDVETFQEELQEAEELFTKEELADEFNIVEKEGYRTEEEILGIGLEEGLLSESGVVAAAEEAAIDYDQIDVDSIEIDTDIDEEFADVDKKRKKLASSLSAQGQVSFSIDYSLNYSRLGALARLCGLFIIALIPHIIVYILYLNISLILGFINYIVVMATGKSEEDFIEIQANTLRYYLSINASGIGIVEEFPVFAGRADIDYPLQMDVTFPSKQSRLLAFLRLTGVGIFLISLPHLVIVSALSIVLPLVFLVGVICVIALGKWPQVLFDFVSTYLRYLARVSAFVVGLVDDYPSFRIV